MQLHLQYPLISARRLAPLTALLQHLYRLPLAVVLLLSVVLAHVVTYRELGLPPLIGQASSLPGVIGLLLVSMVVHELGHLAACRRFGAPHGPLGIGLYFFAPLLYVDVTPAWQLSRLQRVVVDLGGAYFQLLFSLLLAAAFWVSSDLTYLWVIVLIDLTLLVNLNPLLKLDGYWFLSDALGVPNLHTRMAELVVYALAKTRRLLLGRGPEPRLSHFAQLRPATLLVLAVYTVVTIDLWLIMLALLLPVIIAALGAYPALLLDAGQSVFTALRTQDALLLLSTMGQIILPTLIALNAGILLLHVVRSLSALVVRKVRG